MIAMKGFKTLLNYRFVGYEDIVSNYVLHKLFRKFRMISEIEGECDEEFQA